MSIWTKKSSKNDFWAIARSLFLKIIYTGAIVNNYWNIWSLSQSRYLSLFSYPIMFSYHDNRQNNILFCFDQVHCKDSVEDVLRILVRNTEVFRSIYKDLVRIAFQYNFYNLNSFPFPQQILMYRLFMYSVTIYILICWWQILN